MSDPEPEVPADGRTARRDRNREAVLDAVLDLFADEVMLAPLRFLMHRTEPKPEDLERWNAKEMKAREAEPVLAGHFAELDRKYPQASAPVRQASEREQKRIKCS